MGLTFVVYETNCPACGGRHKVHAQTGIARGGAPGTVELRIGDAVELADLAARGYLAAAPPGSRMSILDNGTSCGRKWLWTEITIDHGTIVGLELVPLTLAT